MSDTASPSTEHEITSTDGTRLAIRRVGQGPPLVLVHGAAADKNAFALVEPQLASSFEVWVYDRRGRGGSSDAQDYSVAREADDLVAIVEAASRAGERPTHVFAHSFGGFIALHAARRCPHLRSLAVYEPPMFGHRVPSSDREAVVDLASSGSVDSALERFLRSYAGATAEEVAGLRAFPTVWAALAENAGRTLTREIGAITDFAAVPFDDVDVPLLVMYGEDSTCPNYPTPAEITELFPTAKVAPLAGQRHLGLAFAPEAVVEALVSFWAQL